MLIVIIILFTLFIGVSLWVDKSNFKDNLVFLVLCVGGIVIINDKLPEKQKSKIITPEINVSIELKGDSIISSDTVYIYYFEK